MLSFIRNRGPIALAFVLALWPHQARSWGDEGHEIVALIAEHFLLAPARQQVQILLETDDSELVLDTTMMSEAVWADRYRDSDRDGERLRYQATWQWHFVDIELGSSDLAGPCYGRVPLPAGMPASRGPGDACVIDKIEQFEHELKDAATSQGERRVALQFLLHLVGDLHQPLHASDEHDKGGNAKHVEAGHWRPGSLHHYWDVEFVRALGSSPREVAAMLIERISARDLQTWQQGGPVDWARDSNSRAQSVAYGMLPRPDGRNRYYLDQCYVEAAIEAVQLQLMRGGVRLAALINRDLG